MAVDDYGFYFELAGRAGYQGPNDPSGEYFTNKDLEQSLTREIIQNSMDARSESQETVIVEFDLREMRTDEIPGIAGLRVAAAQALEASQDLQGKKYLSDALGAARQEIVPVLRVGDSGTKGLTGSESKNDPHRPLSTLTRSTGASSNDGDRGGSFGIGSAVGPLASRMRTVAYVSKRESDPDVVYAAMSRLASFVDGDGEWRLGTGYFTLLSRDDDFEYLRNPEPLGDFPARTENGTDVYIFDYREAGRSAGLVDVKRAAVENFLVAIHRGRLIVKGRSESGEWTLDRETLGPTIDSDEELVRTTRPFFRAITESTPVIKTLRHTGECQLFVHVDETLDKKLGTLVMRKPLMKVQPLPHAIHVPYAAVFICEDEKGNELLRDIEPPTHDKWNHQGPRSHKPAVDEIKRFIREELQRIIPQKLGQTATIRGLAKFLPIDLGTSTDGAKGTGSRRSQQVGVEKETPVRLGRPEKYGPLDWRTQGAVSLPVVRQGNPEGEDYGGAGGAPSRNDPTQGGGTGGSARGSGQGGSGDGTVPSSAGDGRSRIPARSVKFRSFADGLDGYSTIVLTALEDVTGDLELMAMGAANREDFKVAIEEAAAKTDDGLIPVSARESTLEDIVLQKDEQLRIRVKLGHGAQYRLGVKNG